MANDPAAPLPYVEVAAHLASAGIAGGATGWALERGLMPSTPDQVLAVFPAGGAAPEGKYALSHPNIQLRARGAVNDQTPPYLKIEEAIAALRAITGLVLGAGRYVHLIPESDVLPLGKDDNGRFEFVITFRAAREPAA